MESEQKPAPRRRGTTLTLARAYQLITQSRLFGAGPFVWDHLVAASGIQPAHKVIDIDCDDGYFTAKLASAALPYGVVVGLCSSQQMLDDALRRNDMNAAYILGPERTALFEDNSFDVAVSVLAFHRTPLDRRLTVIEESYRILRPGGRLLIADIKPSRNLLSRLAAALLAARALPEPQNQRSLITSSGFSVIYAGELPLLHYVCAIKPEISGANED